MKNIAILIDQDFEDEEFSEPVEAMENMGHAVTRIGLKAGKKLKGKKDKVKTIVEKVAKNVTVNDFDALFIPGGYSPDHLRTDKDVVNLVKDFVNSGKPVFVICHGPQLLISAEVLSGRKITGWLSIKKDIENAGAEYIDEPVVADRNIISGRGLNDLPDFIEKMTEILKD